MEARARLLGHPVHQILIVFPLGLLGMSVLFDAVTLFSGDPKWSGVAFWMLGAGIVSGLVAAPFGTIDWLAIPKHTRAKQIGLVHAVGNVIALLAFATAWLLRRDLPSEPTTTSLVASGVGFSITLVTGWLGGELVNRLGIGVYENAHVNAPSSLRTRSSEV